MYPIILIAPSAVSATRLTVGNGLLSAAVHALLVSPARCFSYRAGELANPSFLFSQQKKSESRPSIHSLVGDLIGKEADGET